MHERTTDLTPPTNEVRKRLAKSLREADHLRRLLKVTEKWEKSEGPDFDLATAAKLINRPKQKLRQALKCLELQEPLTIPTMLGVSLYLMLQDAGETRVEAKQAARAIGQLSLNGLLGRFADGFAGSRTVGYAARN